MMLSFHLVLNWIRPFLGGCGLCLWLLWRVNQVIKHYSETQKRRNIRIVEYPTWLGRWISGLRYLLAGPDILLEAHIAGSPYAIRTPETYYVHLSSSKHIKELVEAPEGQFSLHALSKDMFQPKYTMNGLQVQDRMNDNGSLHTRVLRVTLRSHLKELEPTLSWIVADALNKEYHQAMTVSGNSRRLEIFSMTKRIVTAANSLVFFGKEQSQNAEFLKAALDYPEDLLKTAEILRFLPAALAPYAAPLLMHQHRASKVLVDSLMLVIEARIKQSQESLGEKISKPKPTDCIQFFIDANARKGTYTSKKIVQVLLGIWFAAVHQPAITLAFALDDLCAYPEYVEPLRAELRPQVSAGQSIEGLPLLDSFLKESARLHPSDSISCRRKVLTPYVFSDGTRLSPGDVACVPLQAIMLDPEYYPNPLSFDGFRFVNQERSTSLARFSDSTPSYPLWGLGKRACPGRYYADCIIKLVMAHVLLNYEVTMPDGPKQAARKFYWRSSIVPRTETALLFRPLAV